MQDDNNAKLEKQRDYRRQERARKADIGDLPPVANQERRAYALLSPRNFAETYHAHWFYNPFERAHDDMFQAFREALEYKVRRCRVGPRSMGKTSLLVKAAIPWALLSGRVRVVVYICENKRLAMERLELIKLDFETNDMLAEDFPEVCAPIRALDGRAQRAAYQTHNGVPTRIEWTCDSVTFPTISGSIASGAVVRVAGMKEGVRGVVLQSGRPDFVVIDDPDGDESAGSAVQQKAKTKLITRGLAALSGQGRGLGMVMLGSIINVGCTADQFSDVRQQPVWCGARDRLLVQQPVRQDMWEKYVDLIRDRDAAKDKYWREAHRFYLDNRAEMDLGADVLLHHIHDTTELPDGTRMFDSTLEFCYWKIAADGVDAFRSEYQNDPVNEELEQGKRLDPTTLMQRLSVVERGIVPGGHQHVTAFVDVGSLSHVHWMVCAWANDFTGSIIDYGRVSVGGGESGSEESVYAAVQAAMGKCCRLWVCEDGTEHVTGICMVDRGWKAQLVYRALKESARSNVIASRGIPVPPGSDFLYPKGSSKKGSGIRVVQAKDPAFKTMRQIEYYSSMWKSFAFERLRCPMGARGRMAIFGRNKYQHRELCRHLSGEKREPVLVKDGTVVVDTWDVVPGEEVHWWDCAVGCIVGAKHLGCELEIGDTPAKRKVVPMSFSDMQRARRGV
jgi:hypothetical protein